MAKTHDRTRTAEAKQETLRRRQARTTRLLESRATDRGIKLMTKGY